MTEVSYPYEHILFYDDHESALRTLDHVLGAFDAEAELYPLEQGHPYAVLFSTEEEFTQQEANILIQKCSPAEYDLNHYPWSDEDEDLSDGDEDESLDFEDEEDDDPVVFTEHERDLAIVQSEDNDWTIEYIRRLERIAYTAYVFLVKSCNLPVTLPQVHADYNIAALSVADLESALHAELATVNFMD